MAKTNIRGTQIANGSSGVDLTVDVFGTLPVGNGGLGVTNPTTGRFLVGNGTSAVDTTKVVPTGAVVGDTDTQTLTNKTLTAEKHTQQTTPATPGAGLDLLYPKSDDDWYAMGSDGVEVSIMDVHPVRVSTTAEFALTGIPASGSTDGVTVANGDRVLVRHQGIGQPGSGNGVYVVNSAGAWTRSVDANTSAKLNGLLVSPTEGAKFRGVIFRSLFKSTDTLGTTNLGWANTASQIEFGTAFPNPAPGQLYWDDTTKRLMYSDLAAWQYINPGAWVDDLASATSYNMSVTATTQTVITSGGPYSVTVPSGRTMDVQFKAPLVDTPAGTGCQIFLLINGAVVDAGYWSNSGTTSYAVGGVFLTGSFVGTGAAVNIQVNALKVGSGTPSIQGGSLAPVRIRHRLT